MPDTQYNLANLIETHRTLDKVAVIDSGRKYSYKQLNDIACQIANGIRALGIIPGQHVAIKFPNSLELIASYFGVLRAGCVAVLINVKLPKSLIDYVIEDSSPVLMIDETTYSSLLVDGPDILESVTAESPAVILYTSGTSGKPKGVVIAHKHKWAIDQKSGNKFLPWRITLIGAPCYHANGLTNMEVGLAGKSTLVLMANFDPAEMIRLIDQHKISSINTVPSIMASVINELATGEYSHVDLSLLTNITMASAPLSRSLAESIKKYCVNAHIANRYGITEVGPGLFAQFEGQQPVPPGSVGYPLPGIDYRLVDSILQVRSPSMMLNYNNQPNPNLTEDGYYNTNDIFEVDEIGAYYFIGRADDMFVNGGNNVYPTQVEKILEEHSSIREAAVIGLDDDIKGVKPYAFVVASTEFNEQQVSDYMFATLPASNCPKRIWKLDSFPLTAVNKIDKRQLKIWAQELNVAPLTNL